MRVGVAAVVPAAGQSTRFGTMKLLADVGGAPLLERTLASLLDAGVARVVVVTRAGEAFEAVPSMADPRVTVSVNPDPARGMFSSIQAGCAAAAGGDPLLVLPGDMPFVRSRTVAAVLAKYAEAGHVVSPRHEGRRGHPIALTPAMQTQILNADAGMTLNVLLKSCNPPRAYADVDDPGIVRDVDRREDL